MTKISGWKLATACAAVLTTIASLALMAFAGEAFEHFVRHGFEGLSPAAQARAASLGRMFALGTPGLAAAIAAIGANRQRARRERERMANAERGRV